MTGSRAARCRTASPLMIDEEDKQAQMVLEHNYFVEALEDAAPAVFAYDREEGTE